ncbi:hypothetical protein J4G33_02450 [Actinotalea sp. BY-33]|uniref:Uncharacterized protein n=1 Tax=Actinotalea soli TaxID=2819234 RepID=A0A939LNG1_9CELL|nr:Imm26 family immunity protein [Actinotalea soli]MBO1750658.1 hypothetical protein [Actinotalea soli]
MSRRRLVEIEPGSVFAVPLFLADEPITRRLAPATFAGRGSEFAFSRVIVDLGGAGFLVEVFDLVGTLATDLAAVTAAPRLFDPVALSGLGISKRRWPLMGVSPAYDAERDSRLSEVRLVMGADDDLRLWHGGSGASAPVSATAAAEHEPWTIWNEARLEARTREALTHR